MLFSLLNVCFSKILTWMWNVVALVAKLCLFLSPPHGLYPTRLPCPWDFPGKNIGLGCHFLLQGIFLTQGLKLHLLYWQADFFFLPLNHLGNPIYKHTFEKSSHYIKHLTVHYVLVNWFKNYLLLFFKITFKLQNKSLGLSSEPE